MHSEENDDILKENLLVGCQCYNPNLSHLGKLNSSEYVKKKKIYISSYLTNVVIHKSSDLIGLKKCFGKRETNIRILQSSYRSHKKTIQKFREFGIKKKSLKTILLPATQVRITADKYINTTESVCDAFENIFSIIFLSNNLVSLDFLVKSCQFHLQTLNIFEEIINEEIKHQNGRSLETFQHKSSENASIQLEQSVITPV